MPNAPKSARPRQPASRAAARLNKARREQKIVALLNSGVSISEIAAREGVTERRVRQRVQEILARRAPSAPTEFVALQVSRLNEALLVSYSAMANQNLGAVDRVVKIVRELDRYHGLAAPDLVDPPAPPPRRLARVPPPLALPKREETAEPV
jgi:DNA-binding CsgD family transcriptional regulator